MMVFCPHAHSAELLRHASSISRCVACLHHVSMACVHGVPKIRSTAAILKITPSPSTSAPCATAFSSLQHENKNAINAHAYACFHTVKKRVTGACTSVIPQRRDRLGFMAQQPYAPVHFKTIPPPVHSLRNTQTCALYLRSFTRHLCVVSQSKGARGPKSKRGEGRKGVREQEEESARALSPSERKHVRESVLGEGDTAGAKPRIRETAALDGIGDWFRQLAHRQDAKFHEGQHFRPTCP